MGIFKSGRYLRANMHLLSTSPRRRCAFAFSSSENPRLVSLLRTFLAYTMLFHRSSAICFFPFSSRFPGYYIRVYRYLSSFPRPIAFRRLLCYMRARIQCDVNKFYFTGTRTLFGSRTSARLGSRSNDNSGIPLFATIIIHRS